MSDEPTHNWINCADQLPPLDTDVITRCYLWRVITTRVGRWLGYGWQFGHYVENSAVVEAWVPIEMPRPAPQSPQAAFSGGGTKRGRNEVAKHERMGRVA